MKKNRHLIIVTLISFSCASLKTPTTTIVSSQPEEPSLGIQEIDPDNPPLAGVWMTWEDAYALARYQRDQRMSCNNNILEQKKNYEICAINLEETTKIVQANNSKIKNWLATYGLPVGIILGGVIGVAATIAIGVSK